MRNDSERSRFWHYDGGYYSLRANHERVRIYRNERKAVEEGRYCNRNMDLRRRFDVNVNCGAEEPERGDSRALADLGRDEDGGGMNDGEQAGDQC